MLDIILRMFKWSFFLYILSFILTGLTFLIYHLYYGSFIALSFFVPYYILDLMMYSVIWGLFYIIYLKVYWE